MYKKYGLKIKYKCPISVMVTSMTYTITTVWL